MELGRFILIGLVVYRVARMLAVERGAFNAFENWRAFIAKIFGVDSWVTEGFACPSCLSFWFGLLGAMLITSNLSDLVLTWIALSGLATWLYKVEK